MIIPKTELNMLQLWDIHVSLTREVILADVLKTPNLPASLEALLNNQKALGANLAEIYGKTDGCIYAKLLTRHIEIAVKIVNESIEKKDTSKTIALWYENAREIACFLSKINKCIKYDEIKKLFFDHLDCTLTEATLIIQHKFKESAKEYLVCLERTRKIALYLIETIPKHHLKKY
jgi:hypothetical protein